MFHSSLPLLELLVPVRVRPAFLRLGRWALTGLVVAVGLQTQEAAASDRYVPYSGIERGTEGVTALALVIENAGPRALGCTASLAHWYSETLGTVEPGGRFTVTLWHDPETGSLSLLNALQDRMPVEAVTCGPADTPHAARLTLPFAKGPTPAGRTFRCAPGDTGWACTATE